MYALLFPVSRGAPLPPDIFAARILRKEPARASISGAALQALFGLFWGLVAAAFLTVYGPIAGSHLAQGLVWGLAAFAVSCGGFLATGIARRPLDVREWSGHFLNHLVFGFLLGAAFLVHDLAWG